MAHKRNDHGNKLPKQWKRPASENGAGESSSSKQDNRSSMSQKEKRFDQWKSNRSSEIPIGRSFQTRDEFIEGGQPKAGYEDKGYYRRVFVIETNNLDELAIIKSTTSEKGKPIKGYDDRSRFRNYVYTLDDQNNPIKKGAKFIENPASKDISEEEAARLLKKTMKQPNSYSKVTKMKKRKK